MLRPSWSATVLLISPCTIGTGLAGRALADVPPDSVSAIGLRPRSEFPSRAYT